MAPGTNMLDPASLGPQLTAANKLVHFLTAPALPQPQPRPTAYLSPPSARPSLSPPSAPALPQPLSPPSAPALPQLQPSLSPGPPPQPRPSLHLPLINVSLLVSTSRFLVHFTLFSNVRQCCACALNFFNPTSNNPTSNNPTSNNLSANSLIEIIIQNTPKLFPVVKKSIEEELDTQITDLSSSPTPSRSSTHSNTKRSLNFTN